MKDVVKNLWVAITLLVFLSGILLVSDLGQRKTRIGNRDGYPRIAIMQFASTPLLDTHVGGIISRLKESSHYAPDGSNVRIFNAQGDYGTANAIARDIANGPWDLVITSSTVALQVFAKANQSVKKLHVFGAVTDPYGAGVGITGREPHEHPPNLAGVGTFQPVERAFRVLHEMNPGIRRVGVVWNPGEQCSEACMYEARAICAELGIELKEAVATVTAEVAEAVKSLLASGVDAVWIGGDTVAIAAAPLIISSARQAGVPVITNDPTDSEAGALFGLGADYHLVGRYTADVAIALLDGEPASSMRIDNVIPEMLSLNQQVLASLGKGWQPGPIAKRLLEESMLAGRTQRVSLERKAKIALVTLIDNIVLDEAEKGIFAGLMESGLQPGTHFDLRKYSANGEIGSLPQIIEAAINERPDLLITLTTPAFIAAVQRVKDIPLVFSVASKPERLGLFAQGRPDNVCGYYDDPPLDELLAMAKRHNPSLQRVGIVYDPAQVNARISAEKLREAGRIQRIQVVEANASTVSELDAATRSLTQRGAQAILLSADNLVYTGFNLVYRIANQAGVPIFATEVDLINKGATGVIGNSFFDWGKASGILAAQVLAGTPPSRLPIRAIPTLPPIESGVSPISGRQSPFRLRLVLYSETEFAEKCRDGLKEGLRRAGFIEGSHFHLREYNAQGDMSTLSGIMNTIRSENPDLLMVVSTPTLQAALRQAGNDFPIVFTGVGDAVKAGAGSSETDHLPHVTGITTRSPFEGMAKLIRETLPSAKRVGTLFTPAEINSVLYKDWFSEALRAQGLELVALPVTSSAEVSQAAIELCTKDIQVVAQVVDNLTRPGFALIARRASERNLPTFVFDSDQMKDGGTLCLARDYFDAGLEAAEKVVRILRGANPRDIPFNNTKSESLIINEELAARFRLNISSELRSRAISFSP